MSRSGGSELAGAPDSTGATTSSLTGLLLQSCGLDGPGSRPAPLLRSSGPRYPSGTGPPESGPVGSGARAAELGRDPEEAVVGLRLTDRAAAPLALERADHDAGLLARRGELRGVRAERQPHEVGLGVRNRPALIAQRGEDPGPL